MALKFHAIRVERRAFKIILGAQKKQGKTSSILIEDVK